MTALILKPAYRGNCYQHRLSLSGHTVQPTGSAEIRWAQDLGPLPTDQQPTLAIKRDWSNPTAWLAILTLAETSTLPGSVWVELRINDSVYAQGRLLINSTTY